MVKAWQTVIVLLGVWAVVQPLSNTRVEAQLDTFFYLTTCPQVYGIVAKGVYNAIQNETRTAATLLRTHFHDCFVQGCDASIALASLPGTNSSELLGVANNNSIPFSVITLIESIKVSVESSCPGVVSCADIITLGAFFSVILSRGPIWLVPLGRRDSFVSGNDTTVLPNPNLNFSALVQNFQNQNLSTKDLVALSGGHTIGKARCFSLYQRLYNFNGTGASDPSINATLLASLETLCPNGGNASVTTFIDLQTGTVFDNLYYQNLLEANGLFQTDQELYDDNNVTQSLVELYASDQTTFFQDFTASMIKMGNLNVLTGTEGEIRLNCSVRNPSSSFMDEKANLERAKTKARTETVYNTLERTESAKEFFTQVLKLVAEEIQAERLAEEAERLVEESVPWGYSSM